MFPSVIAMSHEKSTLFTSLLWVLLIHGFVFLLMELYPRNLKVFGSDLLDYQASQIAFIAETAELKQRNVVTELDDIIEFIHNKLQPRQHNKENKELDQKETKDDMSAEGVSASESMNQYVNEISRLLAKHKYYPEVERRRGREGSVLVSFTIHTDGSISDVSLIKPSSYNLLNRASIDTVYKAAPYPALEGNKRKLTLTVSLDYRLND